MTDSDSPELQTLNERETNQQLQFDTELDASETGRNCHVCLKLKWDSSSSPCVCVELPLLS